MAGVEGATRIAVGQGFACALASGKVKCWGAGGRGQLGGGAVVSEAGATEVLAP